MTHKICCWPKTRGCVSNTYLPPSKELTLHSYVQGSHSRQCGIWCVQVSCKVKRMFSCFFCNRICFFLETIINQKCIDFLKKMKRTTIKNSCRIFFQRLCLWCSTVEKKMPWNDRNHQYLKPKLTNKKIWSKLLLFHISRRLRMCRRATVLLWLLSIM